MSNRDMNNRDVSNRDVRNAVNPVMTQTSPGLEVAALLSEPLPADVPTAHTSPVGEEQTTWAEGLIETGALAQYQTALAADKVKLGELRAQETPELFRKAQGAIADCRTQKAVIVDRMKTLQKILGNRIDRTPGVVRKVIGIYVGLALGEVALNTASGVSLGEEPLISAISFIGVAAGAVALGWATGSMLRDATDRICSGQMPQELRDSQHGTGLRPLFLRDGRGPLTAFTPSFWMALTALICTAVANSLLVGGMRVEAGMGAAWGPVAAMLVLAAAAPPYLLRNQAADVWEAARNDYQTEDSKEQAQTVLADTHTAAQRRSQAFQQAIPAHAAAQYLAALAGGLGQLTTTQTHIVGHISHPGAIPTQIKQHRTQIKLSDPTTPEVIIDDEHHNHEPIPPIPPSEPTRPAPTADAPGSHLDLTNSSPAPFPLDPSPASGNGHH